ncbi:MAG: Crp/Fnr family transcriptional regulator [Gammaproteobacteria bacterium]|nr:Crp/Fnr family transcriptional regulator [Gammaproteobacteria bacterium]
MKAAEKKLADIFRQLPEQEQKTLLDFAEFIKSRTPSLVKQVLEPLDIPRPEEESVVAAIKRLNKTYPMIKSSAVLHETSDFMMQHIMRGRPANEVIDDLEALFKQRFRAFVEDQQ